MAYSNKEPKWNGFRAVYWLDDAVQLYSSGCTLCAVLLNEGLLESPFGVCCRASFTQRVPGRAFKVALGCLFIEKGARTVTKLIAIKRQLARLVAVWMFRDRDAVGRSSRQQAWSREKAACEGSSVHGDV